MLPPKTLRWITESLGTGAEVFSCHPQGGATSSTLHRIEVRYRGRTRQLMLRRYSNQDWLIDEPDVAFHEAASLKIVGRTGLPAPELIAYDPDGSQNGVPTLLMTCLPGRVNLHPDDLDDWLTQQAEILLPLHSIDAAEFPWHYAPYNDLRSLAVPSWSTRPRLWERAIEIVNGPAPPTSTRFIHRDYHPVNVLWRNGRLSGVVDWPNACLGPACIDVSWCRKNLVGLYGVDVADRFLSIYQGLAGEDDYHPYWDLMVIIESLPGPPDIYSPWIEFGVKGLTGKGMVEREEAYLEAVLTKWSG